jgi:hypothetical protein
MTAHGEARRAERAHRKRRLCCWTLLYCVLCVGQGGARGYWRARISHHHQFAIVERPSAFCVALQRLRRSGGSIAACVGALVRNCGASIGDEIGGASSMCTRGVHDMRTVTVPIAERLLRAAARAASALRLLRAGGDGNGGEVLLTQNGRGAPQLYRRGTGRTLQGTAAWGACLSASQAGPGHPPTVHRHQPDQPARARRICSSGCARHPHPGRACASGGSPPPLRGALQPVEGDGARCIKCARCAEA